MAIVTGAAENRATTLACEGLERDGWTVVGMDFTAPETAVSFAVDLADVDAVNGVVRSVLDRYGSPQLAIAGGLFYEVVPFDTIDPAAWEYMFRVHLGNAYNLCRAVAPSMIAAGSGHIIVVSSEFAFDGTAEDWWSAHYAAAKGGILGLTRSLAAELAEYGVRVNGVAPGPTETSDVPPGIVLDDYRASLPLRRRLTYAETAEAILFLANDGGGYLGQTISPNAGAVL